MRLTLTNLALTTLTIGSTFAQGLAILKLTATEVRDTGHHVNNISIFFIDMNNAAIGHPEST